MNEAKRTVTAVHSRLGCTHHFLLEVPLPPLCVTHSTIIGVIIKPPTFRLKIFLIVIICKWVVGFRVGHLWSRHEFSAFPELSLTFPAFSLSNKYFKDRNFKS